MSNAQLFSAETYFATQPPPPTLDADIEAVRQFVSRQAAAGRRVVLVTVRIRFLRQLYAHAPLLAPVLERRNDCSA